MAHRAIQPRLPQTTFLAGGSAAPPCDRGRAAHPPDRTCSCFTLLGYSLRNNPFTTSHCARSKAGQEGHKEQRSGDMARTSATFKKESAVCKIQSGFPSAAGAYSAPLFPRNIGRTLPANMSKLSLPGCRPGCRQPAPASPTALFDPPALQTPDSRHECSLCYFLCHRQAPEEVCNYIRQ